jgi:uncharacterized iron-regulated membrane protein
MAVVKLRKLWRDIHLWIGAGLVVLLIPLSLTGSWLVFDEPIDRMLHPARYSAPAGPAALAPSAYLEAARQAFGDRAQPAQLRMPQRPGLPATVASAQGWTAWLDPATGKVQDVGNPRGEIRGFMHQMHGNLLAGLTGRRVIGVLGAAMFISCLTGIYLWWPRNNAVLKAFRWRRSPSQWSNLHHIVGIWIVLPLAILSLTGVFLAFPEILRMFAPAPATQGARAPGGPQGGGGRPGQATQPIDDPQTPVDLAVAAALASAGPGRVQQIDLPSPGPRPAWRITVRGESGAAPVLVDDATGQVRARGQGQGQGQDQGQAGGSGNGRGGGRPQGDRSASDGQMARSGPPAQDAGAERGPQAGQGGPRPNAGAQANQGPQRDPVTRLVRQLHAGDDTSLVWQIVLFLTGVAPAILGVTGVVFWLAGLKRKAKAAA